MLPTGDVTSLSLHYLIFQIRIVTYLLIIRFIVPRIRQMRPFTHSIQDKTRGAENS